MRVQTTAGQLRAGLRLFRGIIQRRNTIPVLGMVRLADGNLTGTDLDMELSVALPTIGKMEGAAAIDWFGLNTLAWPGSRSPPARCSRSATGCRSTRAASTCRRRARRGPARSCAGGKVSREKH